MRAALFLVGLLAALPALGGDYVWWEAETPQQTNFPGENPFAPEGAEQADALSQGRWIGGAGPRGETWFLQYEVEVPEAGVYDFYARKFWKHGPFRWRFGTGPWRVVGRDVALLDAVELRLHTVANWVGLGRVDLGAGRHTLRLELLENDGAVAFDAFVLSRGGFVARGRLKPDERWRRAPEGFFAFDPGPDPFAESPLDLRYLNEAVAGLNGPVRARAGAFVRGDGEELRFWGVNAGPDVWKMDDASMDYLARHLAKLGVNLVRFHGPVYDRAADDLAALDDRSVERLQYAVAAMKAQGIYVALSIYFPLWVDMRPEYGFAGYERQHPFALPFFSEAFQGVQRSWWRGVLLGANPHGPPLARDPAVAYVELVNEDSYFFWTFRPYDSVPAQQMEILERQFGDWLEARYGSVSEALEAWGGESVRGDEAAAGRAGFVELWQLANRPSARGRDTARFLTESQRSYFATMAAYLKEDLGYAGLVAGSNWITADARVLGPLDKYSNAGLDLIDRHGYFSARHQGERASFALSRGDLYDDRSALRFEGQEGGEAFELPLMDLAYNDKPSFISEMNWPMPNRFRAELPLAAAAYGALQGSDGFGFFALEGPSWQQVHSKFSLQTPAVMGQFPAAALAYRTGLVRRGDTVFEARLALEDLYDLAGAPLSAPQNLDLFRAADLPAGGALHGKAVGSLDPLAFLVGPVASVVDSAGGPSLAVDLSAHIDRAGRKVRSNTGELLWDWGAGLLTVDAPAVQGAAGFLRRAGTVRLGDAVIQSGLEYGSLVLVALDGRPLVSADRILLQVMSEERNFGWQAPGEGLRRITELGGAPISVRRIAGRVELRRPDAADFVVTALDGNGYPEKTLGDARRIELLPETLYYLIEKSPTGVLEGETTRVGFFALETNYPNPFNSTTRIAFAVPRAAAVDLRIFNAGG